MLFWLFVVGCKSKGFPDPIGEAVDLCKKIITAVVTDIPNTLSNMQEQIENAKQKIMDLQNKAEKKIDDTKQQVEDAKQKVVDTVNDVKGWWDKIVQYEKEHRIEFWSIVGSIIFVIFLIVGVIMYCRNQKKPMSVKDTVKKFANITETLDKIDKQAGANAESVQTVYDDVANNSSQYDILFKGYEKINVKLEKMSKILEKIDNNKNGYDVLENKMVDGEDEDEYFCGN